MCGSSLFSLLDASVLPIKVLVPVCLLAALALAVVAASLSSYLSFSKRQEKQDVSGEAMLFFGFLAFETCVGAYFPCISTLKSEIVPEEARAGVYNAPRTETICFHLLSSSQVYRVPLNLCVVLLLLADPESSPLKKFRLRCQG